ncbi:MAG: hypothetical protein EZS28_033475, partial [Streblomastix strix]
MPQQVNRCGQDAIINKYNNNEEIQDPEQYFKSFFQGSVSNQLNTVCYQISDITQGQFSLSQGIKTCTGGSAEEPTPKGCICQSTKTEQECACQENDQRQPCICLPIGDIRSHCIGHTIPSCDQATSEQLIDASTDICECYSVGDPRSECLFSTISCNDPSADLSNIPPTLCSCNGDDPRRGTTCPVTTECSNISISPKCLCTLEHQSPGCICTQFVHPQDCECDNRPDALFQFDICSSTKTCSGQSGDDEQITQGQCTCGFGHHPFGCLCKDSEDINCFCNLLFSPTGCTCPSNSQFICTCRWNGRETIEEQTQTIWIYNFNQRASQTSGLFSLTQAQPCNETSDSPETDECICKLSQSQQECACYEVGDLRNECSNISKTCGDSSVDLSNFPISRCSCLSNDDPRTGDLCPITNECINHSVSPKCLFTSEHQSPGCICTQFVHPQDCECDNRPDALFQFDICSSTKTCSGQSGNDEQITQGQCTCGEGHHPFGCLCKDSEDIDC